jgi:ubiquinone biosynthesis accessory factor UbiK
MKNMSDASGAPHPSEAPILCKQFETRPELGRSTSGERTHVASCRFDRLAWQPAIGTAMTNAKIIEEISARISDAIATSPARDVDKNVRALLGGVLGRLDLVTRAEFDVQAAVLLRTREKLEVMTTRVAELEAQLQRSNLRT